MKVHDYYDVMGVDREAPAEEIKRKYRSLVLKWHPDRHTGASRREAVERFKEIREAYCVLSDPVRRREYDAQFSGDVWRSGVDRGSFAAEPVDEDFDDDLSGFFSTVYGGFRPGFGVREGAPSPPGQEVEVECALSVSQIIDGGMARVEVPVRTSCSRCGEEGFVHGRACDACDATGWRIGTREVEISIPRDPYDGQELVLRGFGGGRNGTARDLVVTIRIRGDSRYGVVGADVHTEVPVAPWEALDGGPVEIRAPTGVLRVRLPPGTRNGARLRVAENGLRTRGGTRGDLYLLLRYDLPPVLSSDARRLVRELKSACAGQTVSGGARVASGS